MASTIIERTMYGGNVNLVHNPDAKGSSPRYKIMDGTTIVAKPKGVTTILGQTLAKDLIGWAVGCAIEYLKDKVPVITEADLKEAAKAYTKKRDSGASTGTEAHAMVEHYLMGQGQHANPSVEAQNAFNAFVEWFEMQQPEVINVEEVIYSQNLQYAGTYDCMLRIDGKVVLCDLKTTNSSKRAPKGVYAENFIQLGAYALAHEEQRKYEESNGGTTLEKIDDLMVISAKKNGVMDIVSASDFDLSVEECGKLFESVVGVHKFLATTTKSLGG